MPNVNTRRRISLVEEHGICSKTKSIVTRTASAPAAIDFNKEGFPSETRRIPYKKPQLQVVNWNVAAPNKNPFEFWAHHEDHKYTDLMSALQKCIDHPTEHDVIIGQIFTRAMFQQLKAELSLLEVTGLFELERMYESDLMARRSINEFLKDTSFGEKRLISMPDRITSSVRIGGGRELYRPSPITGSNEDMSDISTWWKRWIDFMFHTEVYIRNNKAACVFSMLEVIPRAKYPALSEQEEAISIPLQVLCLALFDAVFTHLLNFVAPEMWQPIKWSLHAALFENKTSSCISILQRQYSEADIIFVQEASESFAARAGICIDHFVLRPGNHFDGRRSQMSLILAKRSAFHQSSARDLTGEVLKRLKPSYIQKGDLCVFEVSSHDGKYLLASFHGDSAGTATVPTLAALESFAQELYPRHTLIFGLDANTTSSPAQQPPSTLSPAMFNSLLGDRGLMSCWHDSDLDCLWTTFNARTHLQPQLHKAVGLSDVLECGNMQLKDWILYRGEQLAAVGSATRDNTGSRQFLKHVIPSRTFPSDHAIVAVTFHKRIDRHAASAACLRLKTFKL